MKRTLAKELGFTNEGYQFQFIPVFIKYEDETMETVGKNVFWNLILSILIDIDLLLETGYSFQAYINENPI